MPQERISPDEVSPVIMKCSIIQLTSPVPHPTRPMFRRPLFVWYGLAHPQAMSASIVSPKALLKVAPDTYGEASEDVPIADSGEEAEHDVLLRFTKGDSKLSTRVRLHSPLPCLPTQTSSESISSDDIQIPPSRLPEFQTRYGALLKSSMAPTMRKRDKKREKSRAEATAKKRRELYVNVEIGSEGKRGKGRRQRVRLFVKVEGVELMVWVLGQMRKVAAQRKKEVERDRVEAREAGRVTVEGRPA